MPELPEVETTRRGIAPYVTGARIRELCVRQSQLRWPIDAALADTVREQVIQRVDRRAKYLELVLDPGSLLIHLGMSGSLRITDCHTPPGKHDHFDLIMHNDKILRFNDPRRFGSLLWQASGSLHPRLQHLGIEPLSDAFNGTYLWQLARTRTAPIKTFIMNQAVVVGVGNIYASEALFLAGIHPLRRANRIARQRYGLLADAIRAVLHKAIDAGGTSISDFIQPDGQHGYFKQQLHVYGRAGLPCPACGRPIRARMIGQRNSFYCPHCQH